MHLKGFLRALCVLALIALGRITPGIAMIAVAPQSLSQPLHPHSVQQHVIFSTLDGKGINAEEHVEWDSLNLFSQGLMGIIPVDLCNLTNLQYISLYNNNLTGAIPAEIGQLKHLNSLNVSKNQFASFDGTRFTGKDRIIYLEISANPLQEFYVSPDVKFITGGPIQFDERVFNQKGDFNRFQHVLQNNVMGYDGDPLRIGFYKNEDRPMSSLLQDYGMNSESVILVYPDGEIDVDGIENDDLKKDLINILHQVRDGTYNWRPMKSARNRSSA